MAEFMVAAESMVSTAGMGEKTPVRKALYGCFINLKLAR
jgi:hypothetical protein